MKLMKPGIVAAMLLTSLGAVRAYAQNETAGPGPIEVALVPGGGTFFASKGATPSFGNYNLGGSVVYNITPWVGVEGEIGGTLGISQTLDFGAISGSVKTPNMATYAGNLIVSAPMHSSLFPYVAGGIGGLTLYETTAVGINSNDTFLTGNVGGGVRWYANRRWGLRGEYRFIAVKSKDDAPAFFGQDTRYGHRVYGAVVVNVVQ
jgi:hypothetical protein